MLFFLLVFSICNENLQINVDNVGFYDPGIQLYKYKDYFLFVNGLGGGLALVEENGKVKGKYLKKGLGPGELHFPFLLGVEDTFLVVSNYRSILSFDESLEPKLDRFQPFPAKISSNTTFLHGICRGKNTYLIIHQPWAQRLNALSEIKFENGKWLETADYFPQNNAPGKSWETAGTNYKFNMHNNVLFRSTATAIDWYEVDLFDIPISEGDDTNAIHTLVGNLETLPMLPPGFRAYISESFKTSTGYVVTLQVGFLAGGAPKKYLADLFDINGKFLKRIPLDSNVLPCGNCETVLIESISANGEEVFIPFHRREP